MSQFSDDEIIQEAFSRMRSKQKTPPRAKVMKPCPKCGKQFGARELRTHKPKCAGNPSS